jgi:hypothetical protein
MYVRVMDLEWIAELDGDGACAAVAERHADLLRVETEQFYLAAHWADLHSGEALKESRRGSGGPVLAGMERSRRVGGDGTPEVAEFAAMELGALQGMGHVAAGFYQRDALNVRHRHPLLWAALGAGAARVWQARKIAQACAHLTLEEARWVDAVTTPYAGSLPWGRLDSLVQAKVVEVDPQGAEERRVAAAMARFVRTGRSSEFGLKTLVARAAAGDVLFFVAMVDRIADILAEEGDLDPIDVRRSKAIGILATPERALRLLLASAAAHEESLGDTHDTDDTDDTDDASDPDPVGESDVHPSQNDADDDHGDLDQGGPWGRRTDAAGRVLGVGSAAPCCRCAGATDPRRLLPSAVLYVHLSEDSLLRGGGVARMEGVGPLTREQVVEFLGHTNVDVRPVVDVAGQAPVDGYEVPARLREALHLRSPACGGPWATHLSRRKDADHVTAHLSLDLGGPPGQTSLDNLAWLTRFVHRVKTHGRWRLRQPRPGVLEWTSPHGYRFRVDQTGTHYLGKAGETSDGQPGQPSSALTARRVLSMELHEVAEPLDTSGWRHAA